MRTLFVAAGGGGDAVGILLARRVLDPDGEGPALIATCAWERLRVDPVPGPRPAVGFTGLGQVNGLVTEVVPTSDTEPSGRSMLPRLAAEADARIFLHDFEGGGRGLAEHFRQLARAIKADRLVVVDVGGDVVATGDEPSLLSPLADSLTLAASLSTEMPAVLAVVGPGTDAELTESQVLDRLTHLGANLQGHIVPEDVDRCSRLLGWHPTEASALVAASALGERGFVEMRRGNHLIPLSEHGCEVWAIETPGLSDFPLAQAVANSGSLAVAAAVIGKLSVNEIGYETAKAQELGGILSRRAALPLTQIAMEAQSIGATHITTRRLLERAALPALPGDLSRVAPSMARVGGLWRLG